MRKFNQYGGIEENVLIGPFGRGGQGFGGHISPIEERVIGPGGGGGGGGSSPPHTVSTDNIVTP